MNLTGDFSINGTSIAVASTDTLNDIRDKINAANTGGTPTGVTATIVKEGTTGGRLVLTRDTSGADGITLTDGTGGLTRELGLVDSRSKPVSSRSPLRPLRSDWWSRLRRRLCAWATPSSR